MQRVFFATAVVLLFGSFLRATEPLPVAIKPTDPKIAYIGRVDLRDPAGPRMQWSASTVSVRFKGTALQMRVKDSGKNRYAIRIDAGEPKTITPAQGESLVDLASGLPDAEHEVQVVKATEAFVGIVQFLEFRLNEGAQLLEPQRSTRRIEVIGDSISCGYGNEAASEKERFSPTTENAYFTYGAMTARALNAEYTCVAWSGKRMDTDKGLPMIYDLALPTDPGSTWDFSQSKADVVLINLATNDFGKVVPDEDAWTKTYVEFVQRVRKNYPDATIYLASGPMMWGERLKTLKTYLDKIESDLKAAGETKLRQIHFPTQNKDRDGLGADWHPNIKTNQLMADQWVKAIKTDLGW